MGDGGSNAGGSNAGGGGGGGVGGGAGSGGGAECTSTADCRLFSSNCETCECFGFAKSEPDPICSGMTVNCFVDPCQGHTPQCDATTGQCVVN